MYTIYNNDYIILTKKLILSEKNVLIYQGHGYLCLNLKGMKENALISHLIKLVFNVEGKGTHHFCKLCLKKKSSYYLVSK